MNEPIKSIQDEWIEADGLGGFASGTVSGIRTRRYHGLLLVATQPPTGRLVLVNGFDASVETSNGTWALSSQMYPGGVVHPDGARRIAEFNADPWPQWTFVLDDRTKIRQEIFAVKGTPIVVLSWRLLTPADTAVLTVRPFFSGRDYHSLHHENPVFQFEPEITDQIAVWRPYSGVPGIIAIHNGKYRQQPDWYRNFVYEQERARGLDFTEDLAAPGLFSWDLNAGEALWILAAEGFGNTFLPAIQTAAQLVAKFRTAERRRRKTFANSLDRAADAYLVKRGCGKTILAGYPWFTDWGRDTFVSLRGLCLATKRYQDARDILVEWANVVSEGMLPNRFPDRSGDPEYNSVDASLWYIIAVHEFLNTMQNGAAAVTKRQRESLENAIEAIVSGYSQGTRFGIRMDKDGLLAAGIPGVQLTWMDAKVGDRVVTPRIGKPVEIQALWLNALWIAGQLSEHWAALLALARESFARRFWNETSACLYDVVDVDHQPGNLDASLRPNQILAVGGLPLSLVDGERAKAIVEAVERKLWTPVGLRSLAPGEPGYTAKYEGGVAERDGGYHQGTVWPWLMGPFVEAWVRVRGNGAEVKRQARSIFLAPLLEHLNGAGIGHVSEIADADLPHTPRGCPFQAWSLAELLRLDRMVLADTTITDKRIERPQDSI